MTSHRIVCTEQVPSYAHPLNAVIVAVGVSYNGASASSRLSVEEVVRRMQIGEYFYTVGLVSGKVASVEHYWCSSCGRYHIRSHPDSTVDNNLDSLRSCSW